MTIRVGWISGMLIAALAIGAGCNHMTPQQKEQQRLAKLQAEQDKKERQQAQADAKARQKQIAEQAKADKKAADEQAKAAKQQQTTPVMEQTAMARANYYPDDRLKVIGYPDFLPENHQSWVDKQEQAMVQAGASSQAMLFEQDFSGDELSAVGKNRLRLMMPDPPPTVYVAAAGGSDSQKQARVAAISKFWQDATGKSIVVKEGANDDVSYPAAQGLRALQRLEKQANENRNQNTTGGMSGDTSPLDNRSTSGATTPNNP